MGCVFCATGQMGFKRHLTSGEIFEQAARFSAKLQRQGLRLSSVVLLGMGDFGHNGWSQTDELMDSNLSRKLGYPS